jgi:type II secretory pathway component GspD/PulD (secretin)
MRMLAVAVVTLLVAHGAHAQQLAPSRTEPLQVNFVNSTFDDVIGFVAKYAGIEVKFDDSATRERRNTKITLKLEGVTLEETLGTLTRLAGLTYKVVDPQTILIYQLP